MRKTTKVLVRALFTLLWVYSLSSCGIWGSGTYKKVSCDFDYSIREEDKTLDLSKYQLGKSYENDSCSVMVLSMGEGKEHTKYVYMKKAGIRKIMRYGPMNNIRYALFQYSKADIGPQYDFDEHGNITDSIDTDAGYTICWAQAMAIGKKHARHKMHKTEPNLILDKGNEGTYEWHFLYDDKKKRTKELVIDAKTGKVIKEYKVRVIV
ncbi:hypothetical protein HQ47_04355 [Porphyromonas macacae]|uniref:PepSY domain-containing protein n=1 Tax=Porphyromonas macacae TaxID=28115 RepID=A0A0A2ECY8_9PORP|nr:PepSY domain-containing protein [Porphyromonas macacae]KGN74299.1 hypothetical protein HQ47_04355 [Porphyromonas macacae]